MQPLIIIIAIFVLYLYILHMDRELCNNFLTGFWKSDMNYCNEADIDDMVLYINNNTNSGHLIITKENELIENTPFNINKSILNNKNNIIPFNNILGSQYIEYEIEFKTDDFHKEEFCWNDEKYNLMLSIMNGTIILYKDDVLFSKLYKDNSISNKFLDYVQIEETL